MPHMGPQPPDQFRFLTPVGRRLFVVSLALAGMMLLFLHWLGIDPPPRPFGTGRQPLYSLPVALACGGASFAAGWWLLKRRGINVIDDDDEET
jgi:hypothetical protein